MKFSILLFQFLLLLSYNLYAQKPPCPGKGNPDGNFGRPEIIEIVDPETGEVIHIVVIAPRDPNEIIGPKGYDSTIKWVSVKDNLPYKILFENDPAFATAPAQKVIIYMPIHPNLNPYALRIGDFGFGKFLFSVPPNTSAYTQRLDVKDSLGVLVDVTAGLDVSNRRAFWIFESIDPKTGLAATLPANAGFLPVNDSTKANGEGFVTLTLRAASSAHTRDSISAQASIIFDLNDPLLTNVEANVIDAVAPVSKLNSLPATVRGAFTISWSGKDDSLGVGVHYYDLYVSKNNSAFSLYRDKIDSTSAVFTGDPSATYSFYTLATDFTGNKEAPKSKGEGNVTVKGTGVLLSAKAFLQGPYTAVTATMTDSLRAKAMLPFSSPYTSPVFTAVGNTTPEAVAAGVFDSTGDKGVTDWIWLELRNSTNPSQVAATRAALLRRDGSVVDMDGFSPVYFNNVAMGNYYVAIRHRNHFGVMTATAIALNDTLSTTVDFTSPATATYGTNAQRNMNGTMVMWAGDINSDKRIAYNGASNDKVLILQKVGVANPNAVVSLYDVTDLNLDGVIKYNGAANDKTIILNNVGVGTPNNVITQQLPN